MSLWKDFQVEGSSGFDSKRNNFKMSSASTPRSAASSGAASGKGVSWEELRKEARLLENQIDAKLVTFSKLGSSFNGGSNKSFKDKSPLLKESNAEDAFISQTTDLSALLGRLSVLNDKMTEVAASSASAAGSNAALHHTLQRHRDILKDYRQEFGKTKANIEALRDREDLLSSVHKDIDDFRNNANGRMDALMREAESARNSDRLLDEQINVALEARESLLSQRAAFKAIQTKLNDLANRFPMINSLVQKINLRKRRDSIILGSVIGVCLLFLIWYAFG